MAMNEKGGHCEKSLSLPIAEEGSAHNSRPSSQGILQRLCLAVSAALAAWTCIHFIFPPIPSLMNAADENDVLASSGTSSRILAPWSHATRKVSLEAHIMSKCPDARACMQNLVVPAMELLEDQVDFRLSFIGEGNDPNSDVILCKHGPQECLGNMILLCAAQLYPEPRLSLGFANCMVGDFEDIPQRDLVETCAMEHGISFAEINECISDQAKARSLLRDSVERSSKANIHTSCTIRLQHNIWCVTGDKRDCNNGDNLDALLHDIKNEIENQNP